MTVKPATPRSIHRAARLVRHVCETAGATGIVDDARVGLARHGVIAAVQRHDTPAIFDWLIDALSYQGVSDNIAWGYMEQHGRIGWQEIDAGLSEQPRCPKLKGYWLFEDCGTGKLPTRAPTPSTDATAPCRAMICATGG